MECKLRIGLVETDYVRIMCSARLTSTCVYKYPPQELPFVIPFVIPLFARDCVSVDKYLKEEQR
jgi:hypothetical protein